MFDSTSVHFVIDLNHAEVADFTIDLGGLGGRIECVHKRPIPANAVNPAMHTSGV
jgi:hypothetical protein